MAFLFQPPLSYNTATSNICLSGGKQLQYLFKRTSAEVLPASLFQQAGCKGVSVLPGQEKTTKHRRQLRGAQGRKIPAGTAFSSHQPAPRCWTWEQQQEQGWGGFSLRHRAASTHLSETRTSAPARRESREHKTQVENPTANTDEYLPLYHHE